MNLITTLVTTERLPAVATALRARGVGELVVTPVQVHGRPGRRLQFRGAKVEEAVLPLNRVEILVEKSDTDVVETLVATAVGDAGLRIWVSAVTAVRPGPQAERPEDAPATLRTAT